MTAVLTQFDSNSHSATGGPEASLSQASRIYKEDGEAPEVNHGINHNSSDKEDLITKTSNTEPDKEPVSSVKLLIVLHKISAADVDQLCAEHDISPHSAESCKQMLHPKESSELPAIHKQKSLHGAEAGRTKPSRMCQLHGVGNEDSSPVDRNLVVISPTTATVDLKTKQRPSLKSEVFKASSDKTVVPSSHHKTDVCKVASRTSGTSLHTTLHSKLRPRNYSHCRLSASQKCSLFQPSACVKKMKPLNCNGCSHANCNKLHVVGPESNVKSNSELKCHKCSVCTYATSIKGNLTQHVAAVHKNVRPHKCNICSYSSSQKSHLTQHVAAVHKKLRPHKCNICGYSSSRKSHITQHVNAVHKKLQPHKCNICSYAASLKSNLTEHVAAVHKNVRPHKCNICGYSSSRKSNLTKHVAAVHKNLKPHK
ncbi:zinc finger protein 808-like isoform X2 [Hyalella azteca]|uniref:Zinc finger protein 808-like isoform X2 n=1 Tax=Hyalella azteca TaxID=294128 RepID=A0A979FTR4_HYAAZ|nr:zinc finger protein 808-like isoform X2 [Hyalella azteca]